MPNTRRAQRVRLNQRDYETIGTLADLRAIRLDDLASLLATYGNRSGPLGERTTRAIVARWVRLELAGTHPNPRGGLGIVSISKNGATLARLSDDRPPGVPTGLPAWRDLPHDLTTAAVAVSLISAHRCAWTGVATVRAQLPHGTHLPDGVATTTKGRTIAIEVERTAKSGTRWREYISENLERWQFIAYYGAPSVAKALRTWLPENLPTQDAQRVRVYDLGGWAR
ncbi:MAG: hypothetical protein WCP28_16100 [Actinomycetes bacterium]